MKQTELTVTENKKLTENVFLMRLSGDVMPKARPGQFINIKLDGFFLRRPISVCDASEHELTIIYKVVGTGTKVMSAYSAGKTLDVLTGLGNGFDVSPSGEYPLLIGGGVGVPPMYLLAKQLIAESKQVCAILGFNTKNEIFFEDEFKSLGVKTIVTTADGSAGVRGFVTDGMETLGNNYTYTYSCGPEPMLKAVYDKALTGGQYSFEERMGCGFGACMGCSC